MKPKVTTRTLRFWSYKTDCEEAYQAIRKQFKDYVEIPLHDNFRDIPQAKGCDKLIIYYWIWHGEWADPTKEVYQRLYKPKNK